LTIIAQHRTAGSVSPLMFKLVRVFQRANFRVIRVDSALGLQVLSRFLREPFEVLVRIDRHLVSFHKMLGQSLEPLPVKHKQIAQRVDGYSEVYDSLLDEFSDQFVDVAEVSGLVILESIVKSFSVDLAVLLDRVMHAFSPAGEGFLCEFLKN